MLAPWKKSCEQPKQHIRKQRHYFADKGQSSQSYGFSSSHVWMWELDYKESWALKSWCFWTVLLEKTLKSHLDKTEIQPLHSKGNQSWIFIGKTDAEAETPMWRTNSLENTLMLWNSEGGRRWEKQRIWWLDGLTDSMDMSLSQLGVGDGQGSLVCCSPWGHKELDTTEWLNWTDKHLDINKLDGLEEIGEFLETYNLLTEL